MPRPKRHNVVQGKEIYAYCNVKSNQVLYSFSRMLENKHLEQLPDAGANNTPPKLRKDQWRPLWSLQLPEGRSGIIQGMQAFQMLRDFKMLHEVNWEPPKSLAVPYNKEQIERLEKKLENRGGSKKETPYDLIRRKKHRKRANMVMNQKYNSIADLAAVLRVQDDAVEEQQKMWQAVRQEELLEMEELAELAVKDDGAGKKELESQIADLTRARNERKPDRRQKKLDDKVQQLKMKLARMELAAVWVPEAKQKAAAAEEERRVEKERAAEQNAAKARAAKSNPSPAKEEGAAEETAVEQEQEPEEEILWGNYVPTFPTSLTGDSDDIKPPWVEGSRGKRSKREAVRTFPAIYPSGGEGIVVRWNNTLDAEYAEEWPAFVRHEPMGMIRHTAPKANNEKPIFEVEGLRKMDKNNPRESLADKVQRRRAELAAENGAAQESVETGSAAVASERAAAPAGDVAEPRESGEIAESRTEATASDDALPQTEPSPEYRTFQEIERLRAIEKLRIEALKSIASKRLVKIKPKVEAAVMDAATPAAPEVRA